LKRISVNRNHDCANETIYRYTSRKVGFRHPVRNHLETLDSVGVVKTIREALKR